MLRTIFFTQTGSGQTSGKVAKEINKCVCVLQVDAVRDGTQHTGTRHSDSERIDLDDAALAVEEGRGRRGEEGDRMRKTRSRFHTAGINHPSSDPDKWHTPDHSDGNTSDGATTSERGDHHILTSEDSSSSSGSSSEGEDAAGETGEGKAASGKNSNIFCAILY